MYGAKGRGALFLIKINACALLEGTAKRGYSSVLQPALVCFQLWGCDVLFRARSYDGKATLFSFDENGDCAAMNHVSKLRVLLLSLQHTLCQGQVV